MASLFTKIIKGEIPAHKIMEDEQFLAFLDINPIKPGHTLVIPKHEIDYIFDIEDDLLSDFMIFAKQVSRKISAAIPCKRIGIMVCGLEVPHAHIHLIPTDAITDLNFQNAKPANAKELEEIALKICSQK